MKSVLLSIKPKYCKLIVDGKKTLEIRKSKPKIETPFKCYIYCTGVKSMTLSEYVKIHQTTGGNIDDWHGKVIGEFVCDKVGAFRVFENGTVQDFFFEKLKHSCLSYDEIAEYIGRNRAGYSWHISNLKIYDKPKELNEFRAICRHYEDGLCGHCEYYYYANNESYRCEECMVDGFKPLKRPPQSWCYVKELEGGKNDRA